MLLLSRVAEGEEDNAEEAAEVEEVVVDEGEYQYRREQSFLQAEKRNRHHRRKLQQPKELRVALQEQVELQKRVTMLRVKTIER